MKGKNSAVSHAGKITIIYFSISCLWIVITDRLAYHSFQIQSAVELVSMAKGLLFVSLTSLLIFQLVYIAMKKVYASQEDTILLLHELETSNALFASVIESPPEVYVYSLDLSYRYLQFNQNHYEWMLRNNGVCVGIGMDMAELLRRYPNNNLDYIGQAMRGDHFSVLEEVEQTELEGVAKAEEHTYLQCYYSPIMTEKGIIGITCFAFNVTLQKTIEKENEFLSYHDKLTGLFNRRYYEEALVAIDAPENLPLSVVMGDVNGLKLINDAFGHRAGDELLIMAAESISSVAGWGGIAARWGGDEFIILLPKTDGSSASVIAEEIKQRCLKKRIHAIEIDISFGIATKESPEMPMHEAIKEAEDAMYRHKIAESNSMRSRTVTTIMTALHENNPREEAHSKRVGELCKKIGEALKLSEYDLSTLGIIGFLHDIGKIAIDSSIMDKPGPLTDAEYETIKRHPEIGYRIIKSSNEIAGIADIILAHHERWDGTGYPNGLKGKDIPFLSRIVTLTDSFDAMTSPRPYKLPMTEAQAVEEIKRCAGHMFDERIARAFVVDILGYHWY